MYALTRSSYCSSLSGRPRGEYGKTPSVLLLGLPWKSVWVLRIVLSVTSLPKSSLKWQAAFAGPFLIAEQAIYGGDGFFHFSITQSSDLCFLNFNLCRIRHGWRIGCRFSNVRCLTQFNIGIFLPNIYNYSMWTMWASFTDNYLREVTLSSVKLKASRKVTTRQTVKLKTPGIEDVYSINYTFRLFKSKCFCVWGLCRIERLGEGGGVGG